MEITCSNGKEEDLRTNKISGMGGINIVEGVQMAKVTLESVHNIFSRLKSGIQST